MSEVTTDSSLRPLGNVHVCLIKEGKVRDSARMLREVEALRHAGATISLVSPVQDESDLIPDISRIDSPLNRWYGLPGRDVPPSEHPSRPVRIAQNLIRNAWRFVARTLSIPSQVARRRLLDQLAEHVDVFWVIDYLSLGCAVHAARRHHRKVIYETIDLVPEYDWPPAHVRWYRKARERKLIGRVDGFVTVSESYARYYEEKYGDVPGFKRPIVHSNAPGRTVAAWKGTTRPVRMLFFGNLSFDRPIHLLMEAASRATGDFSLTFMGENYFGEDLERYLEQLPNSSRIEIVKPVHVDDAVRTASAYDVGIIALSGSNENERRAETTKALTYMAAGLALLGSNLPGIASVIDRHQCGWLVDRGGVADWQEMMSRISSLPVEEIDEKRSRAFGAARKHPTDDETKSFVQEFIRVASG